MKKQTANGDGGAAPVTIKKYANRRLYNTATSSYVTLDHLCQMVKEGFDFVVYDAKTGEDITRSVLTQIIVEEENKGQNLLPISFLRRLIGFYGDSMQWLVPRYLEHAIQTFVRNQEQMRDYFKSALGGMLPFGGPEEMGKENLANVENAVRKFAPLSETRGDDERAVPTARSATEASIEDLQKQIDELQRQVARISKSERSLS